MVLFATRPAQLPLYFRLAKFPDLELFGSFWAQKGFQEVFGTKREIDGERKPQISTLLI